MARSWLRVGGASALMAVAVVGLAALAGPALAKVVVGVVAGVTVYLVAAKALGVEELTTLLRIRRRLA